MAYQRAGLLRQIRSRMDRVGVLGFREYRAYLAANPEEHQRLCEAVPVHWTHFCRDPDSWQYLAAEVVPDLLARTPCGESIRVWSAGCASGQEAYTLAVLLAEAMGLNAFRKRVRLFATDVSERAVTLARAGRYTARQMEGLPPAVLEKYFSLKGDRWVVHSELKAPILFCRHDLLRDPPFSRLDLIVCRNTLLYFTPAAQVGVLAGLYLVLRDSGVLFIGKGEDLGTRTGLFRASCRQHQLYRRTSGRAREALTLFARRRKTSGNQPADGPAAAMERTPADASSEQI